MKLTPPGLNVPIELVLYRLGAFPTFSPSGTTHVPDNTIMKVGLVRGSDHWSR
jgi:hypothetical protein